MAKDQPRKHFYHELLHPHVGFHTYDWERKRWYFRHDVGHLPSVTSVLGEHADKTWLEEWRTAVGEAEAERVSGRAKSRGNALHDACQRYVSNEDVDVDELMPANVSAFLAVRKVLNEHVDVVYGIEYLVYSKILETAGRTDLIATWDGDPAVIDFKTASRRKTEDDVHGYFLQATTYSMMIEELAQIEIPLIVIILAVDFEDEPQVFVKRKAAYVDEVKRVFSIPRSYKPCTDHTSGSSPSASSSDSGTSSSSE